MEGAITWQKLVRRFAPHAQKIWNRRIAPDVVVFFWCDFYIEIFDTLTQIVSRKPSASPLIDTCISPQPKLYMNGWLLFIP